MRPIRKRLEEARRNTGLSNVGGLDQEQEIITISGEY